MMECKNNHHKTELCCKNKKIHGDFMNKKNNKRRRESVEKIQNAFIFFLETKDIHEITVSDICKKADINRSTFYANFLDIYDLSEKIIDSLHDEIILLYHDELVSGKSKGDYIKLFNHVKENQGIYKTYFKLEKDKSNHKWFYNKRLAVEFFENKNIDYHVEFFRNGFNALLKLWLMNGCKETPEELEAIIETEYIARSEYIKQYFATKNEQ